MGTDKSVVALQVVESLACERVTGSVTKKKTSDNERGENGRREKKTNKQINNLRWLVIRNINKRQNWRVCSLDDEGQRFTN